jgi:hypothetical protein
MSHAASCVATPHARASKRAGIRERKREKRERAKMRASEKRFEAREQTLQTLQSWLQQCSGVVSPTSKVCWCAGRWYRLPLPRTPSAYSLSEDRTEQRKKNPTQPAPNQSQPNPTQIQPNPKHNSRHTRRFGDKSEARVGSSTKGLARQRGASMLFN